MKSFKEEIDNFLSQSNLHEQSKGVFKRRLADFLHYSSELSNSPIEQVHLERIYETVNNKGKTLFFSAIDAKLIDQYFYSNLHKSYSWLYDSRRALQNFFIYLHRRYDFRIITDEMDFKLNEHKQKPIKENKYIPTRHDLLRFLQSLIENSSNLERDLLFFVLIMSTGSRSSEIIRALVKNIDYSHGTIFVKRTKNKSSKYIVLREGVGTVIKRYVEQNGLSKEDYLFNENGRPLKRSELQELFNCFLQKANLPFCTLHKLRHSFATIMAESGADIMIIQQLLGHKKINSTITYIKPNYIWNRGITIQVNKNIYKHIRRN